MIRLVVYKYAVPNPAFERRFMGQLLREFRDFAMRGNVLDLAIGIIIGGAFGKIVSAMVEHVIMPPIGLLIGGVDFKDLELTLRAATEITPAVVVKYGIFTQSVIDFVIVAFAIFMVVKGVNALKKKKEAEPTPAPQPSTEEKLLAEIRDLLKSRSV